MMNVAAEQSLTALSGIQQGLAHSPCGDALLGQLCRSAPVISESVNRDKYKAQHVLGFVQLACIMLLLH